MAAPYEFSEIQATDILEMRLSQLTRLSRIDLQTELDDVQARIIELQSILDSPEKLRGVIKSEMLAIKEEFATPRVCPITFDSGDMSIEDLVDGLTGAASDVVRLPYSNVLSGQSFAFDITEHRKHCLLNGLDEIGLTLAHAEQIKAFETKHRSAQPWLFQD